VTAPRPPTGTATPTSEALPSAAGAEEPFEPYSIHAEKVNKIYVLTLPNVS